MLFFEIWAVVVAPVHAITKEPAAKELADNVIVKTLAANDVDAGFGVPVGTVNVQTGADHVKPVKVVNILPDAGI